MIMRLGTLCALGLALVACVNDSKFNQRVTTDTFFQAPSNAVDILWVIDSSVSMLDEQESVANGAEQFLANLESSGMDFHLGVTNMDMDLDNENAGVLLGTPPVLTPELANYADAFRSAVRIGTEGSDKERGLEAAIRAVSAPLADTRNDGFLRDDASLSIIFLTDEDDCSDFGALGSDATGEMCYDAGAPLVPVADLVRNLQAIKGEEQVTVSGIVGPEIMLDCDNTVPGHRYFTAIELLSGYTADICEDDYASIMDSLGLVASGIVSSWQLEHNASVDSIEVEVFPDAESEEGTPVEENEENGWTYHAEYAQIEFHGDAVPERGARVEVTYTIAPGTVSTAPEETSTAE